MKLRRRHFLFLAAIILCTTLLFSLSHLLPLSLFSVQQKPEQSPQTVFEYYLIIDEETGHTLMYVPLTVSPGDEVITEENRRYEVTRIETNRAYARFVGYIDLERYKR